MPILDQNTPQSYIPYLATGTGVFSAVGSPEGVQNGGIGSIYTNLTNGDLYTKTTAYALTTGWSLIAGGGGSGTVTSFSAGNLSPLFNSNVATATTTPALTFAQIAQNANLVFAGPASGAPANPTFRTLTASDLSLAAAPPANGVQYNDGTNAFTASNGFLFDGASNTIQAGESTVLKGTLQMFAALSAGSVKHTVNNPTGNYVFIWGDSLPANNDLARFSVSGSNVTIESVAASALGFASVNPTSPVMPYNNAGTFADSQLVRTSSLITTLNAGQLLVPDSTASLPAQSFTNAATTGLYRDAVSSQIGFAFATTPILAFASSQLKMIVPVNFSTAIGTASDCGVARRQAGYIRVTNATTGIGGLLVGGSTATPVGQTHLINGAVGVQPLFLEAIASTSVATIKAETSAIQSFAFYPSGKLQGGCNIPTSNQQFSAKGNLKSDVSELGNVGTGQDNLLSFAVPASSIINNGDTVQFKTTFLFAANANNKEIEILFGGVSIFLVSDLFSGSQAQVEIRIKRTGATTAKVIATWISSDVLLRADCQYNEIAVTWASSNTLQVQGEATTTDDIINKELESNVIIAQTS